MQSTPDDNEQSSLMHGVATSLSIVEDGVSADTQINGMTTGSLLPDQWNDQWKCVGTQISTLTDIVKDSQRELAAIKRNVIRTSDTNGAIEKDEDMISGLLQRMTVLEQVVAKGKDEFEKHKALLDNTVIRIERIERHEASNGTRKDLGKTDYGMEAYTDEGLERHSAIIATRLSTLWKHGAKIGTQLDRSESSAVSAVSTCELDTKLANVDEEMQAMKLLWSSAHTALTQDMRELMARLKEATPLHLSDQLNSVRRDLDLEVKDRTLGQEILTAQFRNLATVMNAGRGLRDKKDPSAAAAHREPSPVNFLQQFFQSQSRLSKGGSHTNTTATVISSSPALEKSSGPKSSELRELNIDSCPAFSASENVSPRQSYIPSPSGVAAPPPHGVQYHRWNTRGISALGRHRGPPRDSSRGKSS